MCDSGLREDPLVRRVRVAVEREDAASIERTARELVIDVLTTRVAIDLDRNGSLGCCLEDSIPVGRDAGPRAVLRPLWMSEDVDTGERPAERIRRVWSADVLRPECGAATTSSS